MSSHLASPRLAAASASAPFHAKSAAAIPLTGPPEIYLQPLAAPAPAPDPDPPSAAALGGGPPMGLTEFQSPTFHSTGNPCLDFFFHVVPDTPPETLTRRLHLAWEHDPLKALKLICNLRGTKGTGKADEEGGYRAALWLHENHPMTLALNLDKFAGLGSSKDLPEILCRILEGPDARAVSQQDRDRTKQMRFAKMRRISYNRYRGTPMDEDDDENSNDCSDEDEPKPKHKPDSKSEPTGKNEPEADKKKRRLMWKAKKLEWAKQRKEAKRIKRARRAVERFNTDPDFNSSTIVCPIISPIIYDPTWRC